MTKEDEVDNVEEKTVEGESALTKMRCHEKTIDILNKNI